VKRTALTPLAAGTAAVVCCAGLPALAGLGGGLTAASLGMTAGVAVVVVALVVPVLRAARSSRSLPPRET
jgi:hypothetical protein